MKTCAGCTKDVPSERNYCDFQCMIAHAETLGGQKNQPNGLPITCIKADGSMWEHEHGDHPTYMFPVNVVSKDGSSVPMRQRRSPLLPPLRGAGRARRPGPVSAALGAARHLGRVPPLRASHEELAKTLHEMRLNKKIIDDTERHALIYADGTIALTLYECCYATWSLRDGSIMSGALWEPKAWRFEKTSLEKIINVTS